MNDEDKKLEFQTVVLAALFHDVGKFLQRTSDGEKLSGEYKGSHPQVSQKFVEARLMDSKCLMELVKKGELNDEMLKDLVPHHHFGTRYTGACVDDATEEWRPLAYLISQSESKSSEERLEEIDTGTNPNDVPANAITASVFKETSDYDDYLPSNIHDKTYKFIFPIKSKEEALAGLYSNKKKSEFINSVSSNPHSTFFNYFQTLDSIFRVYLSNVASSTHSLPADISLYDHLRTSAAIAASMYKWHQENDNPEGSQFAIDLIKNDSEKKFLLIGGDLSGIQNFIIEGAGHRASGTARRLRSRSFLLQAFVIALTDRLLRKLDLTSCNLVMSAGGSFHILAPNIQSTIKAIEEAQKGVDHYFAERTMLETSMEIESVKLCGADFSLTSFSKKLEELEIKLKSKALRKFTEITSDPCQMKIPVSDSDSKEISKNGMCRSCDKFPVMNGSDRDGYCEHCDKEMLFGTELAKNADVLEIQPLNISENGERAFHLNLCHGLSSTIIIHKHNEVTEAPEKDASRYLLTGDFDIIANNQNCTGIKLIANYVPTFDNQRLFEIEWYKEHRDPTEGDPEDGHIKPFDFLARYRKCRTKKENGHGLPPDRGGAEYLAVLKADVDNLGNIFRYGLGNNQSVSRIFTLSRTIDTFFSGWIKHFLSTNKGSEVCDIKYYPEDIYTIYSGGDDLALVGRWDDIILFALHLNDKFKELTCDNPDFHLSAGIKLFQPKYPISEAIHEAEELLNKSKREEGKDSVTVMDVTVKWCDLKTLVKFGEKLETAKEAKFAGGLKEEVFPKSAIYRLMDYEQDAVKSAIEKDPRYLRYRAILKYDLQRNVMLGKESLKCEDSKELYLQERCKLTRKVLKEFGMTAECPDGGNSVTKGLKFALAWAAYRKRNKGEELK
jgi:CRISPR-associated protein Csm1